MLQADVKPRTAFEPVRAEASSAEWRVRATLPSGKQMVLGVFASEGEAREWIRLKSTEWSELKECQLRLFGAS